MEIFKGRMLGYALGLAKALCEYSLQLDEKNEQIEPEQVRKNACTILMILTETENFINDMTK